MPPKKKKQIKETKEESKETPEKRSLRVKAPEKEGSIKWNQKETLIYGISEGFQESKLIAGFDMDDTLIKTKSGKKFAANANDWQFWDPSVPKKLSEQVSKGYSIVIFTNQGGIAKSMTKASDITKKIQMIADELNLPIAALIASANDQYRKPTVGMWKFFEENINKKVGVDLNKSIYCGDAAGRKDAQHKDFSDSDIKFATNIGITFQTPENFFLGEKKQVKVTGFDPKSLKNNKYLFSDNTNELDLKKKEMIIFCGSPASGKSTFWQNHLQTYERINRDTLKTKEKCYKVAEEFMQKGKSVVIDNTCPKAIDRKYFLDLAKKYDYTARCFFFQIPKDLSFHLDTQREVNKGRQHLSGRVGKIPIHGWFKNVEPPQKSEGFTDVKTVNFVPGPFKTDQDEESFFSFVGK